MYKNQLFACICKCIKTNCLRVTRITIHCVNHLSISVLHIVFYEVNLIPAFEITHLEFFCFTFARLKIMKDLK